MKAIEYTNKPSVVTLRAASVKAVKAGETWVQLTWGENQITIERGPWGWTGRGWIGKNGGQDLIDKLTRGPGAVL